MLAPEKISLTYSWHYRCQKNQVLHEFKIIKLILILYTCYFPRMCQNALKSAFAQHNEKLTTLERFFPPLVFSRLCWSFFFFLVCAGFLAAAYEVLVAACGIWFPAPLSSSLHLPSTKGFAQVWTNTSISKTSTGTSLVAQRLRLCTPEAGGLGSIPGQGTRSHMQQLRLHMPQLRPGTNKYFF